jgi:CBS domain-containing protein
VDELLANAQTDFPVTRDGTHAAPLTGLLTRVDLIGALARHGPSAPVHAAMRPPCPPARPTDPADRVYRDLQTGECPLVPVLDNTALVGLVTRDNVAEALLVRDAMQRHGGSSG